MLSAETGHIPGADDDDCTAPILCSREGCTQVATPGELEHDWSGWTITIDATATTAGSRTRDCLRMNCDVTQTESIPATGGGTPQPPGGGYTPPPPPSGGGGGTTTPPADTTVNVIVDGKPVDAGTVSVSGNTTTVTVNQDVINQQIANATDNVTVVVPSDIGTATARLVVQNVDDMAERALTLTVQVGDVRYDIPTTAIDTAAIMSILGATNTANVPLNITITNLSTTPSFVQNAANSSGFELVLPPIQFNITATYDGKTVMISKFSEFVSRTVEITAVQAQKITTAVVVNPDGTVRQVPTRVYQSGGKWYAEINSLTNSTYALIFNERRFSDAAGKWYEAAVNEMGSRMIIGGIGGDLFAGERDMTCAEFSAIIIKALGLPAIGNGTIFSDVSAGAWYNGAVAQAYEYGLVTGNNGRFDPERKITRQEAMVLIHRASRLAGLSGSGAQPPESPGDLLSVFSDADSVSDWALESIKWNVRTGLVTGSDGKLNPLDNISRAEVAALTLKLLRRAGLVDVR